MSNLAVTIVLFVALALIGLAAVWWYASRVKRELDDSTRVVAGARGVLELRPGSAEQLRSLSSEPILLKQSEEGVRVQIEHRPMLPLMAYVGQDVSAALTEAAVRVTEQWGPRWVVLLSSGDDGTVSAQRLA
jgi:hypothetical protein